MKKKNHFLFYVLFAMAFGAIIGAVVKKDIHFGINLYQIFDTIGKLFINALMVIVVPLVCSSIISSISKIKKSDDYKSFSLKTISIFLLTNVSAIILAVILFLFTYPLFQSSANAIQPSLINIDTSTIANAAQSTHNISNFFLQLIPSNFVDIFSTSHMLSMIIFSIIVGIGIAKIDSKPTDVLQKMFEGVFQIMIYITSLLMKLLPFAVFCLIAKDVANTGFTSLRALSFFMSIVILGFLILMFIILPIYLKLIAKVNPLKHFKAMLSAIITAFSTSSSSATIPVTIKCLEEKAGVSNRIASLIVPLSASLNMAGSCIYAYLGSMFLIMVYNVPIDLTMHILIILLTLLATFGVAGIPSGCVICVLIVTKSIGLPLDAIAILLAIDRILDMFRTATNVFTGSCSAVMIAKLEGEKKILS
jgi:proton glutamate symport protein